MDRTRARKESFKPAGPATAIVSITDLVTLPNRFQKAGWIKNVMWLHFEDVEEEEDAVNCLSDEQALKIKNFITKVGASVERIIIHCDAGVSRSAGIAAAVLRYFGQDENLIWGDPQYNPNRTCYRKMLKAFSFDLS